MGESPESGSGAGVGPLAAGGEPGTGTDRDVDREPDAGRESDPWPDLEPGLDDEADPFRLDAGTAVLLMSGFVAVLLAALVALLPVPYVMIEPGPVMNTLGSADGHRLIAVSGRPAYPAQGRLDLTTVTLEGGPGSKVNLGQVVLGWLDGSAEVVPEDVMFPPGRTEEQEEEAGREQMVGSQESATAAALAALDIPVPTTTEVAGISPESPAAASLQEKDVILAVEGQDVDGPGLLREALSRVSPGGVVDVRVRRDGTERVVPVRTSRAEDGRTLLGVYVRSSFDFPFTVTIRIDNVGGPSAGMMFALGIVDVLTPGELTGGRHVAGTGEIASDGSVHPIGGIRQKLVGARDAGADWFLTPADNCRDVAGNVPDGLRVVRVATLEEALSALEVISGRRTGPLPTCDAASTVGG